MKSITGLLALFLLGTSSARATEILWLRVPSQFSYRDLSTVCSNESYPATLYFGAEVEGLEIKKAVFRSSLSSTAEKIVLTSDEIKDLSLHQDKNGQLWIKTLLMKGRLLNWMIFHAGGSLFGSCKPPQVLASIDPTSFSFKFEVESVGEGTIESDLGKFRGRLNDGGAYQAELQFSESPHQNYSFEKDEESDWSNDELISRTSPVFMDPQDCRAIAMGNPGLCRNRDCRGGFSTTRNPTASRTTAVRSFAVL